MNADLIQGKPSNARCLKCGFSARIDKFSPEIVPIEQSNVFEIKITSKGEGLELATINMKCPICDNPYVETLYESELN